MDIAFLGLGRMGRELVPHLIDAGHRVTAWNRSPGPAEAIGRRGARIASTAAEAVDGAEAVVSVLFGPETVREVIVDGGLPWRPGALWIDVTTVAPARFASARAVSMRGWFVPGFCPTTTISSACTRSVRVTLPFPIPIVSVRAVPDDSWHMFEQSGRLLVPRARTRSW